MRLKKQLEEKYQRCAARVASFGPFPPYLNELGGAFYELGRFDEAQRMFKAALEKDPSFELARANLTAINSELERKVGDSAIRKLLERIAPIDTVSPLIRLGPEGDGGYLVPNDLSGIEYCFSPGVGPSSDFEAAIEAYGMHSFLADASVDGPATALNNFTFDKLFLGDDGTSGHISLASWVNRYIPADYNGDLLLQMDIEGAEHGVLQGTPSAVLRRFRIMIIEFHWWAGLRNTTVFGQITSVMDKILEDFHVAHIHPNNCCGSEMMAGLEVPRVMELTFLRKDRDPGEKFVATLPNVLDSDCVPGEPSLTLDPAFLRPNQHQ